MSDETVFAAALEKADPTERAAFLAAACPDPAARERVERLLAAHDQAGAFLNRPAVAPEGFPTVTQAPGDTAEPDDALAFLTPSARPDALGRIGHYEVLQVLGKGAFGIVFRAFDDVLQRVVAVKVLAPPLAATSPARKRFLREAQSSARVRHENVVQVYEVAEQPLPHIVMEFIPGETLQQRLNRLGPVDAAEVVRVGRQIAEGLAAAHAQDLIHRDIKPGNILIEGGQGRVKITDFGLARAADDASISQSGVVAGTPMFMSPEQARGDVLDARSDLFSLGSVLYQMAAGRPPFRANNTVAVLKRVAEDTPRDIREIIPETPPWLCAVIAKLHAKAPADRYQSAREVADVLADCEAQLKAGSKLKDFSRIPALPAAPRARRWGWVAAAVLVPVTLVALAFALPAWPWRGGGVEEPPAHVTVRPGDPAVAFRVDPAGRVETGVTQHQQPVAPGEHSVWFRLGDREFRTAPFVLRPGDRVALELAVSAAGAAATLDGRPLAVTAATPPTAAPSADGFVPLFNGKDLTGWKTLPDAPGQWEVRDGVLVGSRLPSILFSARGDYANFHLRVEARINLGGDSGVFFRTRLEARPGLENGPVGPVSGFEAEIHKNRAYARKTGTVTAPQADGPPQVLGLTADDTLTRPDEWFTLEVIADRDRFVTKVNGRETADCRDPLGKQSAGHIGLQVWNPNTVVQFRKVEIKELPSPAPAPAAFTNDVGMEFVRVPKGKAWLGGGGGTPGDREVEIPADFFLGRYEVTQEEWEKVTGLNPSHFSRTGGGRDAVTDVPAADLKRFPVENVSRDDAQVFLNRLNQRDPQSGWVYRLPTETEWEYACRGGLGDRFAGAFHFYLDTPANELLPGHANTKRVDGLNRPCKVGSYPPNRLGLHDLHGNVTEWCGDDLNDGVVNAVVRGGSWGLDDQFATASRPYGTGRRIANATHGLRVARVPASAAPPAQAPVPAVAPFTPGQAAAHQEAWAKHLGVPVETAAEFPGKDADQTAKMTFRLIPPGEFVMGAAPGDDLAGRAERPQHTVRLTRPFYLGVHEVTVKQFEAFAGKKESRTYETLAEVGGRGAWGLGGDPEDDERKAKFGFKAGQNWRTRPAKKSGDDHPVTCLACADAGAFCAWLSRRDGKAYRLPTEAEWEFACRAGTTTRYWFGDAQDRTQANLGQANLGVVRVGGFPANPFGLRETHGNVGEWVRDAPRDYTPAAATDPVGTGADRVYRGGQWFCKETSPVGRSSDRSNRYPADRPVVYAGFRVALDLGPPPKAAPAPPKAAPVGPPAAVAPFDGDAARAHQEAWAKHLGVPVETASAAGGVALRLIPPGEFLMGAEPADTVKKNHVERPQHPVRLTRPFYLGAHEVTVGQFRRFADEAGYKTKAEVDDAGAWGIVGTADTKFGSKPGLNWRTRPDKTATDDHPVTCLAWADAEAFCAWLSKTDGKAYRLPTEAEWEFACRAGTTTRYWFGEDFDRSKANLERASPVSRKVRFYPPNPFGLYEVHGNVGEWCQDPPREYTADPAADPVGAGTQRTYRGGQWFCKEGSGVGRSSDRSNRHPPDRPIIYAGFRVLCEVGAPAAAPGGAPEVAPPPRAKG